MKDSVKIENPDEIELTLTVTMSLSRWRKLKEGLASLDNNWAGWAFGAIITDRIDKANKEICTEELVN